MDAAVGMHSHFREIGAYFSAERSGRLPVRTSMCLLGDPRPKSIVPDAFRAGLVTGTGHDMLRVGPVKIFTDGSAGGRTAWMWCCAYTTDGSTTFAAAAGWEQTIIWSTGTSRHGRTGWTRPSMRRCPTLCPCGKSVTRWHSLAIAWTS